MSKGSLKDPGGSGQYDFPYLMENPSSSPRLRPISKGYSLVHWSSGSSSTSSALAHIKTMEFLVTIILPKYNNYHQYPAC